MEIPRFLKRLSRKPVTTKDFALTTLCNSAGQAIGEKAAAVHFGDFPKEGHTDVEFLVQELKEIQSWGGFTWQEARNVLTQRCADKPYTSNMLLAIDALEQSEKTK